VTRADVSVGVVPVIAGGLEPAYYHKVANRPSGAITVSASGANSGHVARWDTPIYASDCTTVVSDRRIVEQDFVFYFLKSQQSYIQRELRRGAAQPHVYAKDLAQLEIPLPPLAEQQRIVAKLDEIDSDLRTLTEHLDAEYLRSAQVRLSAVDSLFDGITAPEKPLAAVCDVFADGDWIESKDQSNTGIRLVQTGNVGDGVFKDRRDKARWIDENTFSRLNCTEVVPGDILFSRLPDPVGRACMIPDTGERMITAVDCTIARPSVKVVDPEFMVLFASSSRYFAQVRSMITGTTRDRISRKNLGDVPIPVPTLSEQKQIVLKAREIDSLCAEVSENIERRKAKAGELRQSVLAAAFRGEL
jgi:type I restriction enzyme S subunit